MGSLENEQLPRGKWFRIPDQSGTARSSVPGSILLAGRCISTVICTPGFCGLEDGEENPSRKFHHETGRMTCQEVETQGQKTAVTLGDMLTSRQWEANLRKKSPLNDMASSIRRKERCAEDIID